MRWMFWVAAMGGCAGSGNSEPETCEPGVTLGGAGTDFAPLVAGDPVTLVHGPQGGWHVELGLRVTSLEAPVDVHTWIEVLRTGDTVSESWLQVQPWAVPDEPCAGDFTGMYGFLDVSAMAQGDDDTPPELLVGETLAVAIEVVDSGGETVSDAVEVTGRPDPSDEGTY